MALPSAPVPPVMRAIRWSKFIAIILSKIFEAIELWRGFFRDGLGSGHQFYQNLFRMTSRSCRYFRGLRYFRSPAGCFSFWRGWIEASTNRRIAWITYSVRAVTGIVFAVFLE